MGLPIHISQSYLVGIIMEKANQSNPVGLASLAADLGRYRAEQSSAYLAG